MSKQKHDVGRKKRAANLEEASRRAQGVVTVSRHWRNQAVGSPQADPEEQPTKPEERGEETPSQL